MQVIVSRYFGKRGPF